MNHRATPELYSGGYSTSSELPYYPPRHNGSNPSFYRSQNDLSMNSKNGNVSVNERLVSRTPSPTPSEAALLSRKGVLDTEKLLKWRFWIRKEWIWYYVIVIILLALVILISVYDRQIVHALQPTAEKIRDLQFGWVIPIAIFFIISFPPLFGHEILAILCGVVWGLWVGFAITAAGTFLGEIGNFYAFRYCCRARGEKLEKTDLQYGCLARIVRDGGFKVALIARYSAIPGHFTTAVFSACGMGIFVFALAAFLSLPKQFVTVYIGVIIEQSGTGTESTKDEIISKVVLGVTVIITIWAMYYIYNKMDQVKSDVVYRRRKNRQAKYDREANMGQSSISVFNPSESESNLPLNPGENSAFQRWDRHGIAAGISGDPSLPAPKAKRAEAGGYNTSSGNVSQLESVVDLQTGSTSTRRSPTHAGSNGQENMSSVDWAAQSNGTYRLQSWQPHTPLSESIVKSSQIPLKSIQINQTGSMSQQPTTETPLPPPLDPPPPSPKTPVYGHPYQQPQSPYALHTTSQQVASPTYQDQFHAYSPTSYSDPYAQTPQQSSAYPMQYMTTHHIPRNQPLIFQPSTGPSPLPHNSSQYPAPDYVLGASGSTAYYTPSHSHAPTENDQLPSPAFPTPGTYKP